MGALLSSLLARFYEKKLDLVIVGLENSGKSTLLSVLATGVPVETIPTIGLSVKVVRKNSVTLKCWDIGGQKKYRQEWSRYTSGCDVILFVVDVSDFDKIPVAREELKKLPQLVSSSTTPLLILANKIDLSPRLTEAELVDQLSLEDIQTIPWIVMPTSAINCVGVESVMEWLLEQ
ncbi:hypothetical protein TL16_g02333, partial [Triparma laevis f. inornata]